jgi:hypothetical protein
LTVPVAFAVDDEVVGGRGEPVDGGLGEERVGHQGQPFGRVTVGGDDRRGPPVAFNDGLVEIRSPGRVETGQGEVVNDQHVNPEQFAELGIVTVVEPGHPQPFEQMVGPFELDAASTKAWPLSWPPSAAWWWSWPSCGPTPDQVRERQRRWLPSSLSGSPLGGARMATNRQIGPELRPMTLRGGVTLVGSHPDNRWPKLSDLVVPVVSSTGSGGLDCRAFSVVRPDLSPRGLKAVGL